MSQKKYSLGRINIRAAGVWHLNSGYEALYQGIGNKSIGKG